MSTIFPRGWIPKKRGSLDYREVTFATFSSLTAYSLAFYNCGQTATMSLRLSAPARLLQQPIVLCMRPNEKPVSRIAPHVCQRPIAVVDTGAPDFADFLEFERRMRVVATPKPVRLACTASDRRRQRLIHTPESTGRRRLHRGDESFPERCRLRFRESRSRALRILNLPRFGGPSRSDTFELSKPKACRSLLSEASRLRLRFLPPSSWSKHSFNGAAPPMQTSGSRRLGNANSSRSRRSRLHQKIPGLMKHTLNSRSPLMSPIDYVRSPLRNLLACKPHHL